MVNNVLDLLPTDQDVASYQENGYWISPPILSDEVLDAAERGMHRHYAEDVDHDLAGDPHRELWGWRATDGEVLRKNDYASLRVDELALLVGQSVISATAARLSGAAEIRLWHDQLLYKPSGAARPGNVGWHTDRQYWRSCASQQMLTAWVPFHDVTEAHGPLMFAAGSHRWQEEADLSFFDQDLSTIGRYADAHDLRIVTATLGRGQVSFHHVRTLHGSGPNHSGEARRSIAVHLQPGDNHHVHAHNADGSLVRHGNDRLAAARPDGTPDYADPAVCPRLWPPVR
ncbi:phytanoyl-CoA dioxygenase family protein [Kitasatospora viridis]|uniref:Phytanoyl-CoA dioxygenase PhyH n=1 Tax=Kitasatospora viridis TaxID=281105 RepID=A0A561TSL3_9ACTN|nr:phytanoyl-CoA dioxygenase family protein [Kitasatospora viridis]TWF90077.1 phytanoyl-CoA dioxygenase PhyH [Kitasatospora viridis]